MSSCCQTQAVFSSQSQQSLCFTASDLLTFCFPTAVVSVYVEAFDAFISGPVAEYITLSQKIGGDVLKHVCATIPKDQHSNVFLYSPSGLLLLLSFYLFIYFLQAELMKQGFSGQRQLLVTASCSQKPSDVSNG